MRTALRALVFLVLFPVAAGAQESQQQFANLGDFTLESGEVIRDCRLGYRTFGQLNTGQSNAVLFPTWFGGVSAALQELVGPAKLVDTSRYFVIAVDALGNGVSTSPSNSQRQPRMRFPKITIRDMVNSEYELATKVLHLTRLKAVIGISMGGMQTFQWMVAYPEFIEQAIPIVGSPRLAAYDLLQWYAAVDAIRADPAWNNGNYTAQPARGPLYQMGELLRTTPEHYNRTTRREDVLPLIARAKQEPGFDANNYIRQCEAMIGLDISAAFGGSMEKAAAAVKAKVLVVVATTDHLVTPGPALDFARLLRADVLQLPSDCGHLVFTCETAAIGSAINAFLGR